MRAGLFTICCIGACAFAGGDARAEPTAEQAAAADRLFQEGLELMRAGDYATACPKLQKSLELDPGTGTRQNLGFCYEAVGRTASAWSQFNAVVSEARRSTPPRPDREKTAQQHADALFAKLSYLTLVVPPAARTPGLKLLVDGADWLPGEALPADPGTRTIEATAPGFRPFRTEATLDAEHPRVVVAVPALEPLAPVVVTAPAPAAVPSPGPATAPTAIGAPSPPAGSSSQRTLGYVTAGLGVTSIAVGAVAGLLALEKNSDSRGCGAAPSCVDASYSSANTLAWVADVALPAGIVATGVGLYLVLTSPTSSASAPPRAFQSGFRIAEHRGGAAVEWTGSW
jgi:hypothetical protein